MGSLSTNAGRLSDNNISVSDSWSAYVHRLRNNDGVIDMDDDYALIWPAYAYHDLKIGRTLDNYHKRKNQGELLPYTAWTNLRYKLSTGSTPTKLVAGYNDPSKTFEFQRWYTKHPSLPCLGGVSPMVGPAAEISNVLASLGLLTQKGLYVQRAASKLYSRGWDFLTFVAELHKTVKMFKQILDKFNRLIDSFYAVQNRSTEITQNVLELWLESRYGWRILMYDIEDFNNYVESLSHENRSRCKDRVGDSFIHSESKEYFLDSGSHRVTAYDNRMYDISVRGSIIADFIPSSLLIDIPKTAWELTKLSWVLDWFLNVGRALDAFELLLSRANYTAAFGIHVDLSREVTTSVEYFNIWTSGGYSNWDQISLNEEVTYNLRQPTVVPYLPIPSINLNAFKVVDLMALMSKIFGRLP